MFLTWFPFRRVCTSALFASVSLAVGVGVGFGFGFVVVVLFLLVLALVLDVTCFFSLVLFGLLVVLSTN